MNSDNEDENNFNIFFNDYFLNSLSDLNLNRLFNGLNLIDYNNDEDDEGPFFSNIYNFSDSFVEYPEDLIDKFMSKLLTFKINDEIKKILNISKCLICQEDFKNGDEIKKVHYNHCFHSKCIVKWLKINNTCPICKLVLIEEKDKE